MVFIKKIIEKILMARDTPALYGKCQKNPFFNSSLIRNEGCFVNVEMLSFLRLKQSSIFGWEFTLLGWDYLIFGQDCLLFDWNA